MIFFLNTSWITIVLTLLNSIFGAIFLYYLIKIKGQSFFLNPTRERGIIRPLNLSIYCYNYMKTDPISRTMHTFLFYQSNLQLHLLFLSSFPPLSNLAF
jgi:hypothetical protein